jgi:hypothetical protein
MQASPSRDDRPRSTIERLLRFLDRLTTSSFFGKVVIGFQNGRVTDVRIEQTKKLDEL